MAWRTAAAASWWWPPTRRRCPRCERLARNAQANGVEDLQLIDGAAARELEPALHAVAALHSSATGIIDSHGFMLSLLGDAEDHGAMLALKSPLVAAQVRGRRLRARGRRRRADAPARAVPGQLAPGWPPATSPRHRRPARGARARHAPLQGQLLHAERRARAVLAPDLPDARGRRPGRAPDARPRRPGPLRPRHRVAARRWAPSTTA